MYVCTCVYDIHILISVATLFSFSSERLIIATFNPRLASCSNHDNYILYDSITTVYTEIIIIIIL